MPGHSASSGAVSRWSWLAAGMAVVALVLVVRPALGNGQLAGSGSPDPAVAAPAPTTPSPTPGPTRSAEPSPTPSRTPEPPPTSAAAAEVPRAASGELAVVPGTVPPAGTGRPITYRLEVERGLPFDGAAVAAQVHRVLTDPRGWQPIEHVAFGRTEGDASFELILASPALVDRLCYPLDTIGELSCRNGDKVVLNARRWALAVPWYAGRVDDYRAYMVNHEVGHRLGHSHVGCPAPGAPAPVMLQQTKSLYGCKPNPWPSVAV